MQSKRLQSRRLSQDELEAAAEQDGTTVMRSVYDNHFDAWPVGAVDALMKTIVEETKRSLATGVSDVDQIRTRVLEQPGVAAFETLHPTTTRLLCTPSFVCDEDSMGMVRNMMRERHGVERGHQTQEAANQRVANDTLSQLYQAAKRAEAEAEAED